MSSQTTALEGKTIIYGRVGEHELAMDLFLPPSGSGGGEGRPGVVLVHGGGWRNGHRGSFRWHAAELARLGYVAATISYRLVGVATYPAALDDCQRAVRFLRKHAAEYGLDPARLGAVGSSAGGHLAACLGVRDTRDDSDAELAGLSSRVQCVADIHGVHDLVSLVNHKNAPIGVDFIGGPYQDFTSAWHDASPLRHIDDRSAPMLVMHDPSDTAVPYEDSARFAAALIAAGRPVEFLPVPGAGHGFVYNPQGEWTQRVWPVIVSWLKRHLEAPAGGAAPA